MLAVQSLAIGAVVGAVFAVAKMPVPAPQTLAGVAGIVGLWLGWSLVAATIAR